MSPSPRALAVILIAFGGVLSIVVALVVAIWVRIRSLPLARHVDELAARQRILEEFVSKANPGRSDRTDAFLASSKHPCPPKFRRSHAPRRMDDAAATAVSGPTLIEIPNLTSQASKVTESAASELATRFGAIWEQADAGESAESIARSSGQPIGQVELILALRRQLTAHSGSRA